MRHYDRAMLQEWPTGAMSGQDSRPFLNVPAGRPGAAAVRRVRAAGPAGQNTGQPATGPAGQNTGQPATGPAGQNTGQPATGPAGQNADQPATASWPSLARVRASGPLFMFLRHCGNSSPNFCRGWPAEE